LLVVSLTSSRSDHFEGVWDKTTGRKIRRMFPTLADARAWRSDAEQGVRRGTLRAAGPVTVNEAADALIEGMRSGAIRNRSGRPYKPSVARSYETALALYVRPDLGEMRVGDVKRRHVRRIVDDLAADGAEPSTVRNAIMPLRVIYRRALRAEEIAVNRATTSTFRRTGVAANGRPRERTRPN
jgi:integrase